MKTSPQHHYEIWASNLLYLAFVTGTGFEVYFRRGFFAESGGFLTGMKWYDYLILAGITVCGLTHIHFIRRGKVVAKYLYLVFFTFTILDMLDAKSPEFYPTLGAVNFTVWQVLFNGAAILLLLSLLSLRITDRKVLVAVASVGFLLGLFYIHVILKRADHPPPFEY